MSYPSREEGDKNFFDPEAEKEEEWDEQEAAEYRADRLYDEWKERQAGLYD